MSETDISSGLSEEEITAALDSEEGRKELAMKMVPAIRKALCWPEPMTEEEIREHEEFERKLEEESRRFDNVTFRYDCSGLEGLARGLVENYEKDELERFIENFTSLLYGLEES